MLNGLHFLTHIGLSWIIASLGPRARKDRWLVVLAGTLPDLAGRCASPARHPIYCCG